MLNQNEEQYLAEELINLNGQRDSCYEKFADTYK